MQGIIKSILARNQIELLKHSGLATENVPNTELTLREIVRAQSVWLPHVRLQRPLPRKKGIHVFVQAYVAAVYATAVREIGKWSSDM